MQVSVQKAALKAYRRVLVTSDIHGHGHLLKRLLDEAAFSDEDALIIVGDILEKGPDSLGTLRYVMELAGRDNVFPLMGNVDLWRLCLLEEEDKETLKEVIRFSVGAEKWWGSSVVGEMAREMHLEMDENGDLPAFFSAIRCHFRKEMDFIRQLPTVLETEHFHFVHGGLPHERMDEIAAMDNAFDLLKLDDFRGKGWSFDKYVVAGHWPVALYDENLLQHGPVIDEKRRIAAIDGGCGVRGDGQLNLVITDWQAAGFTHLSATDKEKIVAVDGQNPSATCRNIRWQDPDVALMEKGEKWATVLHHGYAMKIPLHFLQGDKENGWKCYNLTDHRLSVQPGDMMDLIFEHDGIAYCKNHDICGWYEGRYQKIKETEK